MEHKIAGAVTFVPDNFGSGHLTDDNGAYIGNVQWRGNGPEIARRWNAHELMLETLRGLLMDTYGAEENEGGERVCAICQRPDYLDCNPDESCGRARAAIARARGENVNA